MPQQSLTATVEPCTDSFNDSTVSIRSTAVIRITSSGLRELKICSKELAHVSIEVSKVSPAVLTLRGLLRISSIHFLMSDTNDSHIIGEGSPNPFAFVNSSLQIQKFNLT